MRGNCCSTQEMEGRESTQEEYRALGGLMGAEWEQGQAPRTGLLCWGPSKGNAKGWTRGITSFLFQPRPQEMGVIVQSGV